MKRQSSVTGKGRNLSAEDVANSIANLRSLPDLDPELRAALVFETRDVTAEEQDVVEEAMSCIQRAANLLRNLGPRHEKTSWLLDDLANSLDNDDTLD